MACRIHNLSKHRLALDLRGGSVMYVEPNQISPPLREELLYDNVHLKQWVQQGLVRRITARMSDVLEHEERATGAKRPVAGEGAGKTARAADAGPAKPAAKGTKSAGESDGGDSGKVAEKKPAGKPAKDR